MFLEEVELVEAVRRGAEVAVVQALPHLQLSLVLRMHVVIYQFEEGGNHHTRTQISSELDAANFLVLRKSSNYF